MLKELVAKSRSYRRFDEAVKISRQTLVGLVDCEFSSASRCAVQARWSSSSRLECSNC